MARDVDALAREVGLSRAHFYRLFERSTQMTPHVYVNLLRMELAVKIGGTWRRQPVGRQRPAGLHRAGPFHAVFP